MPTPLRQLTQSAILCLALLAAVNSFAETAAPDAAAIKRIAEEFHQALAAGKSDRMIELLDSEALIVEGGHVQTRDEYQTEHLAADITYAAAVPGKQLSALVRQEGDVAWVTSTFTVKGQYKTKEINELAAETMVLTKTADGWRIRAIHWSSQKAPKN